MADTVTSTSDLIMIGAFYDGDDRTISISNPAIDVDNSTQMATAADSINALGTFVKNTGALVGDRTGAAFSHFKSAKIRKQTIAKLDLM